VTLKCGLRSLNWKPWCGFLFNFHSNYGRSRFATIVERDGRTDTVLRHRPHLCRTLRGKKKRPSSCRQSDCGVTFHSSLTHRLWIPLSRRMILIARSCISASILDTPCKIRRKNDRTVDPIGQHDRLKALGSLIGDYCFTARCSAYAHTMRRKMFVCRYCVETAKYIKHFHRRVAKPF